MFALRNLEWEMTGVTQCATCDPATNTNSNTLQKLLEQALSIWGKYMEIKTNGRFRTFFSWLCFCRTILIMSQMTEIFLWEKPHCRNCCLVSKGLYWKISRNTLTDKTETGNTLTKLDTLLQDWMDFLIKHFSTVNGIKSRESGLAVCSLVRWRQCTQYVLQPVCVYSCCCWSTMKSEAHTDSDEEWSTYWAEVLKTKRSKLQSLLCFSCFIFWCLLFFSTSFVPSERYHYWIKTHMTLSSNATLGLCLGMGTL